VTTKLTLYNGALLVCKERFLASLTEEREPRRLLDHVWDNGGVKSCLEEGQWHFAMRTVQIDYDPAIEPEFGFRRAFEKPSDWLRTSALCADDYFHVPLTRYSDESGYWYADVDTLYVRFVSNDSSYGQDLNKWPESFARFVETHFASQIIGKLSGGAEREKEIMAKRRDLLLDAKSKAAQAEPTRFPAQGNWSLSRQGSGGGRDRGNRGNLIG
jgi:hypothetical protein